MNRFFILVIGLLLAAGCAAEAPKEAPKAAAGADISFFSGARLIPGDGSEPIEEATMIVENGKIKEIGKKGKLHAPKGSARVELDGKTIMPALINLHGHVGLLKIGTVSSENYTRESVLADLNRYEYYGVGAVLALGTDKGDVATKIRDEQRSGTFTQGARFFTAGRGITAKGGWPATNPGLKDIPYQVSSAADARKAVSELAIDKVDVVKIWVDDNGGKVPKLKPEIYKAIIDEAHKRNLKVFAHVFALADAKDLVKSGVDVIAHSIRDHEVDSDLIKQMKDKNVAYIPTLSAHESKFVYADKPSWLGEQSMREVYPSQLSAYLADPVTVNRFRRNPDGPALRQQYGIAQKNLKSLAAGGVRIAFGTDSGTADTFPGYFEHRELELMVAAGMSPMEAIKAATSVSAGVLGASDLGVLAPGKAGNFVVLSSNPLESIKNSKQIDNLYLNGLDVPRLPLIQNLSTEVPKVTQADRARDVEEAKKEAVIAAEARLEHFGKFPLGTTKNVRAMPIPMPKGSTADVKAGPPDRITVSLKATGKELSDFYSKALPRYRWQPAAGGCFERQHPISNKTETLCVQPGNNSIVLQITEK